LLTERLRLIVPISHTIKDFAQANARWNSLDSVGTEKSGMTSRVYIDPGAILTQFCSHQYIRKMRDTVSIFVARLPGLNSVTIKAASTHVCDHQ